MKLWKKISENRYELYLNDPSKGSYAACLYLEEDGTMNYSYTFNGGSCSHKSLSATDIDSAKNEIEKHLLEETIQTLNTYQEVFQWRINALSEK